MIAGEVLLPFRGHFPQLFLRLALQRLLHFVDAGDGRADAAQFALVLATDDFLENPLDHEKLGYALFGLRGGWIHRTCRGRKCREF